MKALIFLSILTILNPGCNKHSTRYSLGPPEQINDGLEVSTLEEVGMDPEMILKAIERIEQGKYNEVHSMLIFRYGSLVCEQYFRGHKYQWDAPEYHGEMVQWDRDMLHHTMSVTKSFTSACIGIAVEQGYIDNVHESIFSYLPDHQQLKTGGKDQITIEHLLTMTSGLQWNEWGSAHGTSANDIDRIYFECSNDPLACILERSLESEPGQHFNYNGGGTIVLGEILKNAAMDIGAFASKYLFEPLGIDTFYWYQFENGAYAAEGSLYLTSRDMVKFGAMYLNGGRWMDKKMLSSDWVEKSMTEYNNNSRIRIPIEDSGKNGYGYTWWISEVGSGRHKTKMFRANGWGGQAIMVLPGKEMVVVFTGGNYASKSSLFEILERFILPAIKSE